MKTTVAKVNAWRQRSSGLSPMGRKAQRFAAEFEAAKPTVLLRSGGFCEARTPVCTGFGQHVHHKAGRVGKGVNKPEMLLHVCFACHSHIHGNPAESYEHGWMCKRLDVAS